MVRFTGIRLNKTKVLHTLVATAVTVSVTACSYIPTADDIRPEVNNTGRLRVDPGTLVIPFEDVGDNVGMAPPVEGNDRYKDSGLDVNPAKFEAVENTFVCGEDYSVYLDEKIFQPVAQKISTLPQDKQNNIYFRVMHAGYNYDTETLEASQAGLYDSSKSGMLSSCGGVSMPTFVQRWLGQLDLNSGLIDRSRKALTSQIDGYNLSKQTTLIDAKANSGLPSTILCMWGNPRLGAVTLADYLRNIETQTVGVIPNLTFRYYVGARSQANLVVNSVPFTQATDYVDSMPVSEVNRAFTKYNQFATRACTPIDEIFTDDQSVLFVHLNGYTKTLIYLACPPGQTLNQTLGDAASEIISTVSKTLKPTQWTELSALYPALHVVPKGSKGVD